MTTPDILRREAREFEHPIDEFNYLIGLKDLSWDDCQDAWYRTVKLMPEIEAEYQRVLNLLSEALDNLKKTIKENTKFINEGRCKDGHDWEPNIDKLMTLIIKSLEKKHE